MNEQDKKPRPFAMEFLEEIPEAELEEAVGGKRAITMAISLTSHGPSDTIIEDQF